MLYNKIWLICIQVTYLERGFFFVLATLIVSEIEYHKLLLDINYSKMAIKFFTIYNLKKGMLHTAMHFDCRS